ncbi:MAG: hypothetical protein J6B03_11055 [Candidatus Homeothermus sp.]|nr:hypothetical protein [Candidatus Homeothermus sp.]
MIPTGNIPNPHPFPGYRFTQRPGYSQMMPYGQQLPRITGGLPSAPTATRSIPKSDTSQLF